MEIIFFQWQVGSFDGICNFFTELPSRFTSQLRLVSTSQDKSIPKEDIAGLFFYLHGVEKFGEYPETALINFLHESQLNAYVESVKAIQKIDVKIIYPQKIQAEIAIENEKSALSVDEVDSNVNNN